MEVPIILWGRGIHYGVTLKSAANVDLAPTVLALFGLDPAKELKADGRVLAEALR